VTIAKLIHGETPYETSVTKERSTNYRRVPVPNQSDLTESKACFGSSGQDPPDIIPGADSDLGGWKKTTSRYGAGILFVFKAQRSAHSGAYVTEAATLKTDERTRQIGKLFFDGPLIPGADCGWFSVRIAAPRSGDRDCDLLERGGTLTVPAETGPQHVTYCVMHNANPCRSSGSRRG
jgi:hypothetical protein